MPDLYSLEAHKKKNLLKIILFQFVKKKNGRHIECASHHKKSVHCLPPIHVPGMTYFNVTVTVV